MIREGAQKGVSQKTCRSLNAVFIRGVMKQTGKIFQFVFN